jgi:hypothetical protein
MEGAVLGGVRSACYDRRMFTVTRQVRVLPLRGILRKKACSTSGRSCCRGGRDGRGVAGLPEGGLARSDPGEDGLRVGSAWAGGCRCSSSRPRRPLCFMGGWWRGSVAPRDAAAVFGSATSLLWRGALPAGDRLVVCLVFGGCSKRRDPGDASIGAREVGGAGRALVAVPPLRQCFVG